MREVKALAGENQKNKVEPVTANHQPPTTITTASFKPSSSLHITITMRPAIPRTLCAARPFSTTTAALRPRDAHPRPSSAASLSALGNTPAKPPTTAAPAANGPWQKGAHAERMLNRYKADHKSKRATLDAIRNHKNSADYLRQMPRRWEAGDVYSPHDLSPVEMQKWRKRSLRSKDVVDALGLRPLDMYKNFSLVQEFTSSSGQIVHSAGTSLRPVNQRKIAKMIRRVQGMGIYPTIHDHPEMLKADFFPRNPY